MSAEKDTNQVESQNEGQQEIDDLKALIVEREDLLKRIQAEFENTIKRTSREIERAESAAEARVIARILPLIDTIEAGMKNEAAESDAHKTLTMIHATIMKTLKDLGVGLIESENVAFDPQLHEALMTKDGEDGIVLTVIQHGYRRGDRILRHAKVIVGRKPDEP